MNMEFKVPCVKNFLKENGKVYTVRSFLMEDKEVFVEGIGLCKRTRIESNTSINDKPIGKADLYLYWKDCGFKGDNKFDVVNKWWQTIEKFCKGKPKYLYLVVKVE